MKLGALLVVGILLLEEGIAFSHCLSEHEFSRLSKPLFGIRKIEEVVNKENLRYKGPYYREYKLRHQKKVMTVRHIVLDSKKKLEYINKDQKFMPIVKAAHSKHNIPNLLACVIVKRNVKHDVQQHMFLFFDAYGPSLLDLWKLEKNQSSTERYQLYKSLLELFTNLDKNLITYNNVKLENVYLVDGSYKKVALKDFSHTYIVTDHCNSQKDQVWKARRLLDSQRKPFCTQIFQVLALMGLNEHRHSSRDYYRHNDEANYLKELNNYCKSKRKPGDLRYYICLYLAKESPTYKDFLQIPKDMKKVLGPRSNDDEFLGFLGQ